MAKLDIQVQIKKTITPSTPTPNHLQCLKLSFFDQASIGLYVPLLLYYLPSLNSRAEHTERCGKLQKSLADTLTKFYPLAGRFNKDNLSVNCNDEGVEYVETKVNSNLADLLLQEDGPKIELLGDLLPWCVPPKYDEPTTPLLGVQVNQFNCGGLVIATQFSHIAADGFTAATFINDWARSSRTGTTEGCSQSFGLLSSLFPPFPLPENQPTDGGAKIVTRRFVFDALAIAKLKDRIDSTATSTKPSRVLVVTSLIWKVLVGISSAKHGHSRDSCAVIPVDMRKRTNISSLQHALGNFVLSVVASLEGVNQSRKEFNDFVSLVGSASRDQLVNFGKERLADVFDMYKVLGKANLDTFTISSCCGLPFYEADFGWGKPFWASVGAGKFEIVCLFDTNDGEGIEAWINLKENDTAEFEKHPDILSVSQTTDDYQRQIQNLKDTGASILMMFLLVAWCNIYCLFVRSSLIWCCVLVPIIKATSIVPSLHLIKFSDLLCYGMIPLRIMADRTSNPEYKLAAVEVN